MAASKLKALTASAVANFGKTLDTMKQSNQQTTIELPKDGSYVMQLLGYDIKVAAKSGVWGCTLQFNIVDGESRVGKDYYNWTAVFGRDAKGNEDTSEFNPYFVRTLTSLSGIPADEMNMSEFEAIIDDAVDTHYNTALKTKIGNDGNDRQNFYINSKNEDFESVETPAPTKTKSTPKAAPKAEPEPEPEEDEDEELDFEEGDEVTWSVTTGKGKTAKTEEFTGTILSIDEEANTAVVKTGETKQGRKTVDVTETVSLDLLELVEEDEEDEDDTEEEPVEVNFEPGDEVTFEENGVTITAKVDAVDAEEGTLTASSGIGRKKKTYTVPFDKIILDEEEIGEEEEVEFEEDEDETEDEEEEIDLVPGMRVEIEVMNKRTKKMETATGTVDTVDDEGQTAVIKVGVNKYPVAFDDITVLDDEEEEEAEEEEVEPEPTPAPTRRTRKA